MIIRYLGIQDYLPVWKGMKQFTSVRDDTTEDELWVLEHHPVYTQGQAGKTEHILNSNSIPVIQSDRGGQVTYHGPGQLIAYTLCDLKRLKMGIRTFVALLETNLIELLQLYKIPSKIKCGAPGVYVDDKKIASIGLRVKNGCAYHGIALNVSMDLAPFLGINPCGYKALTMTHIADYNPDVSMEMLTQNFSKIFLKNLMDC